MMLRTTAPLAVGRAQQPAPCFRRVNIKSCARGTPARASPSHTPLAATGSFMRLPGVREFHGRHTRLPDTWTTKAAAGSASTDSGEFSLSPVLLSVAFACAGAFAFGYHLGVVNGPLERIAADLGFAGSKALQGTVVSSTLAGAALGSLSGGGLADWLGRRVAFLICTLPMFAGPLLSAVATSYNMMVVGRVLAGIGLGLSSALVPLYISEIAPTKIRGALGSVNQLVICLGILGALVVNVLIPATDWRTMFYIGLLPAIVLFFGMLICPESPRWLSVKGRQTEAAKAAEKLWGSSAITELGSGKGPDSAGEASASFKDLFGSKYSKPVTIGCVLFAFQQFSGVNALVYFSTSVFKQAGIASGTLASAAVGLTNVIGTIVAGSVVEKTGRKQLLSGSYIGMASCMIAMAAGFGLDALKGVAGQVALWGTLGYIFSFAIGAGPVTGLIVPEMNAAKIRGLAVSVAMVTHWVCNVVIGQNFIGAVDAYGLSSVYLLFGVSSLIGALYIKNFVPETKGKSLAQIESEL